MTQLIRFRQRGSAIAGVVIMGAVLAFIGFGAIKFAQSGANSVGKEVARARFIDVTNSIRVLISNDTFCGAGTFRNDGGSALPFSATNVGDTESVPEIWLGNRQLIKIGKSISGIRITDAQFTTVEKVSAKRFLVELEIKGVPENGGIGVSQIFRAELTLGTGSTIQKCIDRDLYLQTASAMRSGFPLTSVGCNADTYVSEPMTPPANWPRAIFDNSTPYRFEAGKKAILPRYSCSPANSYCPASYQAGSYDDIGAFSWGTTPPQGMAVIPTETFTPPASGCTADTSGNWCLEYWNLQYHPYTQARVAIVDQPYYADSLLATPTDPDWKQHMPRRHTGTTDKIDNVDNSNPPNLMANENRCWIDIVDRPSTLKSDDIFFANGNRPDLSIGCKNTGTDPWVLLGCFRSTDSNSPDGTDNDLSMGEVAGSGPICSTSDILQPHQGGIWASKRIRIFAICGRIRNYPN